MNNTKIGNILTKLLSEQNLKVSELARRVQLPQPTIQRIAAGVCENPHISSLKPIAEYFSITVNQLRGLEPIPKFDKIFKLPLIEWSEITNWHLEFKTKSIDLVITDVQVGKQSYATKVQDSSMDPIFPEGTTLVLDPTVQAKDKSYVIALTDKSSDPVFRQLIFSGSQKLLKPSNPDTSIYKLSHLEESGKILACLVQARHNY